MAALIGRIVYKLSSFDLHIKYKEQILTFYKAIIDHRDEAQLKYADSWRLFSI